MLKISMRSIAAHKLRLALTALAVVLGVAFASGMLMLTHALDRTFLDIFEGSAQDVLVTPKPAVEGDLVRDNGAAAPLLLDDALVAQVQQVTGVAAAAGGINANGAYLLDAAGKVVGAAGPPALGVNWTTDDALRRARVVAGRAPERPDEVVVDDVTYPRLNIPIGGRLAVLTPAGRTETTLVGTFKFGETGGLAGATVTAFVPETAQALFAEPGKWQYIAVAVADGSSDDQVAAAISAQLGEEYSVQTRAQQVEAGASALRQGLSFLKYLLLGFAGISLFVAAFLIANTFSMLIAARGREMALLRAVGATRRQVLVGVLLEAAVLGVLAAALGVALGYGLAELLRAGVSALGLELTAGITATPAAVGIAVLLGVSVTVIAAVGPALRAARTRPIEALRQSAAPADRPGRPSATAGAAALVLAAVLLAPAYLDRSPAVGRTALGALLLLAAAMLLAPWAAVLVSRLLSRPLAAVGGVSGRLAGRNTGRSPRRAAATASALIVGLSLVTSVTVIVASAQRSINELVDSTFAAELVVSTPTGQPFATGIGDQIEAIDGVAHVVRQAAGPASLDGGTITVTALGGGPIESVVKVTTVSGSLDKFAPGTAVVANDFAEQHGLATDGEVTLLFPSGQQRTFTVVAVFEPTALLSGLVLPLQDYREVGGAAQDTVLFVDLDSGADATAVAAQVTAVAAANPLLQVSDATAIKQQNTDQLNQLLGIIYAMLGLSIIIAALGVVNTMVLSVVERTRELGLLRAVGAGRRQVRRMVRWEAVLVSVLGASIGIAVGIAAAVALQHSLADRGIDQLVVPPTMVWLLLVAALVIGVAGAALPARRAARLDILDAIATQ